MAVLCAVVRPALGLGADPAELATGAALAVGVDADPPLWPPQAVVISMVSPAAATADFLIANAGTPCARVRYPFRSLTWAGGLTGTTGFAAAVTFAISAWPAARRRLTLRRSPLAACAPALSKYFRAER